MIKTIAVVIAVLIAGVLAFAATKPDRIHVERSASIVAPADTIYPLINDFRRWGDWSPWEKLDPQMQRTFSGPAAGKGAVYEWSGNSKVGQGRMEILDSVEPSEVTIKLDFIEPIEGHNTTKFTLEPAGEATQITWVMDGPASYLTKIMSVFVSMDTMVGGDFETGLANLKAATEK
jgi:hypothetical protein